MTVNQITDIIINYTYIVKITKNYYIVNFSFLFCCIYLFKYTWYTVFTLKGIQRSGKDVNYKEGHQLHCRRYMKDHGVLAPIQVMKGQLSNMYLVWEQVNSKTRVHLKHPPVRRGMLQENLKTHIYNIINNIIYKLLYIFKFYFLVFIIYIFKN